MAIERIDLDLIEDNPFQPRHSYSTKAIEDLAASIKVNGLLQVPPARRKDGKVQLGFGHLRKRAFAKLAKDDPQFEQMPLEIRQLSDEQMALFALEENIKRSDITPIEIAWAVDKYMVCFTDKTENDLAELLNMTQGNISNMRRVLRLPAVVLEKIEEGRINFTMGRELLVFEGLNVGKHSEWSRKEGKNVNKPIDGECLMLEAIGKIGNPASSQYRSYHPITVDGMHKAIHEIACNQLRTVERAHADAGYYYREKILFDAKAAGCFQCAKMIKTHPTKSGVARWCTDIACWEAKQKEHTEAAAAAAIKKMQADVLKTVVKAEKQRPANISQEISGAVETNEMFAGENESDVTPVKTDLTDETPGRRGPGHKLCLGCMNRSHCDGTGVHTADKEGCLEDELVCDDRMTKDNMQEIKQKATLEIPAELREKALKQAGTRAEVLDIRELRIGNWGDQLKQGYALLNGSHDPLLECIDDPEECVKRCTHGFHYGFNSEARRGDFGSDGKKEPVKFVCTDTKCLARKKAAFTRAKHAAGAARKRAEQAAIKQAVELTTDILDRPRMKLIILGICSERGYYGDKTAVNFFAGRFNIKTKENGGCSISEDKLKPAIIEAVEKLTIREIAQLIVDYMLRRLMDDGDIADYRVQLTKPLKWLGIGINVDYKDNKAKETQKEK